MSRWYDMVIYNNLGERERRIERLLIEEVDILYEMHTNDRYKPTVWDRMTGEREAGY